MSDTNNLGVHVRTRMCVRVCVCVCAMYARQGFAGGEQRHVVHSAHAHTGTLLRGAYDPARAPAHALSVAHALCLLSGIFKDFKSVPGRNDAAAVALVLGVGVRAPAQVRVRQYVLARHASPRGALKSPVYARPA